MMPLAPVDARVMLGTALRGTAASYLHPSGHRRGRSGLGLPRELRRRRGLPRRRQGAPARLRDPRRARSLPARGRDPAQALATTPSPFIVRFFDHGEAEFPLAARRRSELAQLAVHRPRVRARRAAARACSRSSAAHGLAAQAARRILREVRPALDIVHAQGLVHRDLKPSNILLAQRGRSRDREGHRLRPGEAHRSARAHDAVARRRVALVRAARAVRAGQPARRPADRRVLLRRRRLRDPLRQAPAYPATAPNPFEALRSHRDREAQASVGALDVVLGRAARSPDLVQRVDALLDRVLSPEPGNRPQTLGRVFEQIDAILREAERAAEVSGVIGRVPTPRAITPGTAMLVPSRASRRFARRVPAFRAARDPERSSRVAFRVADAGKSGCARARRDVRSASSARSSRSATRVSCTGRRRLVARPAADRDAPAELRGMSRMANGTHVVAGEGGLARVPSHRHVGRASLSRSRRRLPRRRRRTRVVRRVFAVGERASRGTAIWSKRSPSDFVAPSRSPITRRSARSRYLDDRVSYACGDAGALVRVDDTGLTRIAWERSGHLRSIIASASALFAVGTGGHALRRQSAARIEIEKVNTTQDLLGVAIAPDGARVGVQRERAHPPA